MSEQMSQQMNQLYEERVNYICNIPRFTRKAKLENTRLLLRELGNPEKKFKSIHVAGTNGKGSVSKMMAGVLEKSGYKTGLFISPHLERVNERISINGTEITDEDFLRIDGKVMEAVEKLLKENKDFEHPAFFEYIFAMGALYFAEKNCDYTVFETGLGGRLDATNVLTPELCIITSIGMDHMQYLGNSIKEIAGEKAGIIKPGVPVVFNTGEPEADEVIRLRAEEEDAPSLNVLNTQINISYDKIKSDIFDSLPGYQKDNAATVYTACRTLSEYRDISIDEKDYYEVLKGFFFPGRLEFVRDNIVLDGAHNEDAVKALIRSIKPICKNRGLKKISLFFAVSSDKDYNVIIKLLSEGLDIEDVYVSELSSSRKEDAGTVMKLFQKYLPKEVQNSVYGSTDMKKLWETAVGELADDVLLVAVGSLYMVGEIKGFL